MSVGTADLHKAIFAAWNASGLPAIFASLGGEVPSLQDQEVEPGQSYPYCKIDTTVGTVDARMSGGADSQQIIRRVPITLHVYAGEVDGDSRTAKEIAAYLAEEVLKVFGGHPTETPSAEMTLDNGNLLIVRYMNDYGIRTGDSEHEWQVDYEALTDTPVMV